MEDLTKREKKQVIIAIQKIFNTDIRPMEVLMGCIIGEETEEQDLICNERKFKRKRREENRKYFTTEDEYDECGIAYSALDEEYNCSDEEFSSEMSRLLDNEVAFEYFVDEASENIVFIEEDESNAEAYETLRGYGII